MLRPGAVQDSGAGSGMGRSQPHHLQKRKPHRFGHTPNTQLEQGAAPEKPGLQVQVHRSHRVLVRYLCYFVIASLCRTFLASVAIKVGKVHTCTYVFCELFREQLLRCSTSLVKKIVLITIGSNSDANHALALHQVQWHPLWDADLH